MPFDIFISDDHGNPSNTIQLFLEDFDIISELVKNNSKFPLLQKIFFNYYQDAQVFMQDLNNFKSELIFVLEGSNKVNKDVVHQLLQLVDFAIENRKTLKFAGD